MKLTLALNCAVALGLMGSSCSAFTAPGAFLRKSTKIHTGSGWDNDDFLDSLSNPSETAPLADDFEPPQGTMPPVTPQKGGEGEESQGGTRFKEMMSKAQDGAPNYPPPINPYANVIPSSPNQSEQPEQPLANMENMSVEDQAALFRQMMSMQQQGNGSDGQQHEVPAAKPKSFGPMGLDAKGRKIGRNRDADTIANTSDLYFAQLKRDSAVRTVARYSGDEEFAEKIFEDEAIHELEATYQVNPYLAAEREKEQAELAAATEEMMEFQQAQIRQEPDINDTGPKYKELLARKKAKAGGAPPAAKPAAPVVQEVKPAPVAAAVPAPAPVVVPPPAPAPVVVPPPVVAAVPAPAPVVVPAPAVVSAPAPVAAAAANPMDETDNTRRKLRELQGLFLKHRGGPGFGSGRLRTNEVDKFEATLKEVGAQLRAEASSNTEAAAPAVAATPAPAVVATPAPASKVIVTPVPAVTTMATFDAGSVDPRMEGTLACVEGAVQMYRNSPAELQQGILPALRAALLSAANSCTQVIDGTVDQTSYTAPPAAAPAGAQDATIEQQQQQSGEQEPVVSVASTTSSGNDSNSVFLRKVYDALEDSSGQGKFGLGPISSEEGSDLADLVHEMRGVLMEELDTGIPNDAPAAVAEPEGDTSSMYQQMLAKARAAKENK